MQAIKKVSVVNSNVPCISVLLRPLQSTQLTGLAVSKNPHAVLKSLYNRILKTLSLMPEDSGYRKHTTAIIQSRLQAVSMISDIPKLEKTIDCGQIEEVIVQVRIAVWLSVYVRDYLETLF
ncbi:NADH dehydrogenase (ubiquinone) 1 alpha subcomplex subunit 5 [Paragonimus westermani]|uniref:NADH dehydrogenase (Ubiquinone) 1 alpha subcomplex subunit 5 n=1 Tax=Paragonimus westermani TaxID=34504 RepID=A0A5J4NF30_9TREM|nr:NADH dehydrogenase (ubiquinone) 1 alpha subcomplex subunit 5 [Paragonimus westermani]